MLTKVMAYIVFWGLFGVGAIVALYALFLVGFKGYLKIKDLFTAKKVEAPVEEAPAKAVKETKAKKAKEPKEKEDK